MDPQKLQGWHADPFGLHERRYFSAGNPTKLVRDGDVEAYDEPPAPEPQAAEVVAAVNASEPVTSSDETEVSPSEPQAAEVVAAVSVLEPASPQDEAEVSSSHLPAVAAAVSAPGPDSGPEDTEASPSEPAAAAAFELPPTVTVASATDVSETAKPDPVVATRRPRPGLAYTAILLLSIVVAVAVFMVVRGRS